jgi:succinate dehydrogenase / fumarate reductase cytochrome b subunit
MNWLTSFLQSSIGRKLLMALTGLFLCAFLLVHLIGNLQLFKHDHGLAFNTYAVFMTSNPFIKFTSYGLYATIIFHAFWGLYLVYLNKKARPQTYAMVDGKANSSWASRSMGLLGTIILAFIVTHMADFWAEYKFGEVPYVQYQQDLNTLDVTCVPTDAIDSKMIQFTSNNVEYTIVKDLNKEVVEAFKEWWLVALYVVAMIAISFHLVHGFKSAFQTMGFNHTKYNGLIRFIGIYVFGIIVPILFAAMPIYFFLNA